MKEKTDAELASEDNVRFRVENIIGQFLRERHPGLPDRWGIADDMASSYRFSGNEGVAAFCKEYLLFQNLDIMELIARLKK